MLQKKNGMPMYFTRLEELIQEPKEQLVGVFQYIYSSRDTEGTVLEQRIQECIDEGKDRTQTYRMKKKEHRLYECDEDMFNEEQKKYLFTKLYNFLYFFGYFKPQTDEDKLIENVNAKFDVPDYLKDKKTNLKYCGYRDFNKESMDKLVQQSQVEKAKTYWNVKGGTTFYAFHRPNVDLVIKDPYFPTEDNA